MNSERDIRSVSSESLGHALRAAMDEIDALVPSASQKLKELAEQSNELIPIETVNYLISTSAEPWADRKFGNMTGKYEDQGTWHTIVTPQNSDGQTEQWLLFESGDIPPHWLPRAQWVPPGQ